MMSPLAVIVTVAGLPVTGLGAAGMGSFDALGEGVAEELVEDDFDAFGDAEADAVDGSAEVNGVLHAARLVAIVTVRASAAIVRP